MDPIQVRMPIELRKRLDKEVNRGMYTNRSEAIRSAIRTLVTKKGEQSE